MVTKNAKENIIVIFDSSILFGTPISKATKTLIQEYTSNKERNVFYKLPKMVLLEAQNKMWKDYITGKRNFNTGIEELNRLNIFTKLKPDSLKQTFNAKEQKVRELTSKKFMKAGIEIVDTPIKQIDWASLIKMASIREIPFEDGKKEKGFKDMIIAQTVLLNLSTWLKKGNVVFICSDKNLKRYIETKTKNKKGFKIYPSIPDFKSAMRLSEVTSGKKPIEEISKEAALAFYDENNEDASLFIRDRVKQKISEKYPNILSNPMHDNKGYFTTSKVSEYISLGRSVDSNWVPTGERRYKIGNPTFVKKESGIKYVWESTVLLEQMYRPGAYTMGLGNSLFTLNFKITWKSIFAKNGSIDCTKSEYVGVEYKETDFNNWVMSSLSPSVLASGVSGYSGNLTAEGQGTIDVAPEGMYPSPSPEDEEY